MIKKVQDIYPSSKVSPDLIEEYGWVLIEELPTSVVSSTVSRERRVAPTAEASDYLRCLRNAIDNVESLPFGTQKGVIEIQDFAVARINTDTDVKLGFFALLPK